MLKRICVTAAAAAISAATLPAAPVHAEDHRPCVSLREFRGAKPGTKAELEIRWDVRGLAVAAPEYSDSRRVSYYYPACGYTMDEGWVFVAYTRGRDHLGKYALRSLSADATLHGRP